MQLAPGEHLIKEWQYAKSKTKSGKLKSSLVVTDRRIVHQVSGRLTKSRQEILTSSVCGVETSGTKQSKAPAILALIVSIIAIVAGVALGFLNGWDIIPLAVCAVGALLFVISFLALLLCKKYKLQLKIYSRAIGMPSVSIACSSIKAKKEPCFNEIKIKVRKSVGEDIVQTLGTVLLGCRM